mmetsp:Transcript_38087/g.43202  ORF Transcript_38087/g.43202 Transcript_38087/m.43202 type:complete len:344 (-) Transcript_38087:1057-2088(-)
MEGRKFVPYSHDRVVTFNEGDLPWPKVALGSFSRSGNSLIRNLFEQITGIYTGSDMRLVPESPLRMALYDAGCRGESVTDDRIWICKTHFPEFAELELNFKAEMAIILVRNPFDVIDSYFNMGATASQNSSIEETEYERFASHWNNFVNEKATIWAHFHQFWLSAPIPCYIVRYEDLKESPKATIENVFKFLTSSDDLSESGLQKNVDDYFADAERKTAIYKPRVGQNLKSLRHYSKEQLNTVFEVCKTEMEKLGYLSEDFLTEDKFSMLGEDRLKDLRSNSNFIEEFNERGLEAAKTRRSLGKYAPKEVVTVNDPKAWDKIPESDYFDIIIRDVQPNIKRQD